MITYEVSILVLMDITLLLLEHRQSKDSNLTRFNPCFNGYYTFTNSIAEAGKSLNMFQSLF